MEKEKIVSDGRKEMRCCKVHSLLSQASLEYLQIRDKKMLWPVDSTDLKKTTLNNFSCTLDITSSINNKYIKSVLLWIQTLHLWDGYFYNIFSIFFTSLQKTYGAVIYLDKKSSRSIYLFQYTNHWNLKNCCTVAHHCHTTRGWIFMQPSVIVSLDIFKIIFQERPTNNIYLRWFVLLGCQACKRNHSLKQGTLRKIKGMITVMNELRNWCVAGSFFRL